MNRQVTRLCIRYGSHSRRKTVFNDLSSRLFRYESSLHSDAPSVVPNSNSIAAADDGKANACWNWPLNDENIIVGDLAATLDAHRASNKANNARISAVPSANIHGQRHNSSGHEKSDGVSSGESLHGIGPSFLENDSGDLDVAPAKPGPLVRRMRVKRSTWPKQEISKTGSRIEHGRDQGNIKYKARIGEAPGQRSQKTSRVPQRWKPYRPWLAYVDSVHEDRLDQLSSEIRAFEAYLRPTPTEEESARLVVSDALPILGADTTYDQVKLLGSRDNGLAIPTTYFGFVTPAQGTSLTRNAQKSQSPKSITNDVLLRTEESLQASSHFRDIRRIHTRIPIVKAMHHQSGSYVGFQATQDRHLHRCQAQLKVWQRKMPSVRPLFMVMSWFLDTLGLNHISVGGIDPYLLTVMIVMALKLANDAHDPVDMGGRLLHVLDFWGTANLSKNAYSVDPPVIYDKETLTASIKSEGDAATYAQDSQLKPMQKICLRAQRRPSYDLCLRDPTNHPRNLGFHCYAIKRIQAAFRLAHQRLLHFIQTGKRSRPEGSSNAEERQSSYHRDLNHQSLSVLYEMLQADFHDFEWRRSCLEDHVHPERRLGRGRSLSSKQVSIDQQTRAMKYRQRHDLPALFTKPKPYFDDWDIALRA